MGRPSLGRFLSGEPEEPRPRPVGAGDFAGDEGERAIDAASELEARLTDGNGMGLAMPTTDQSHARPQVGPYCTGTFPALGWGQAFELPLCGRTEPAGGALLPTMSNATEQKITREVARRFSAIGLPPVEPQQVD